MLTPVPSAPLSSVAYTIFMIVNGLDLGVCSLFRYWFATGKNRKRPILSRRSSHLQENMVLSMRAENDCSMPALAEHAFI